MKAPILMLTLDSQPLGDKLALNFLHRGNKKKILCMQTMALHRLLHVLFKSQWKKIKYKQPFRLHIFYFNIFLYAFLTNIFYIHKYFISLYRSGSISSLFGM